MRILTVLACCVLAVLPLTADSSSCLGGSHLSYGSYQQGHSYYQAPYYQYQQLVIPQYSLGYQQQTTPDSLSLLEKLERIAVSQERLVSLQAQALNAQQQLGLAPQEPPHVQALRQDCSQCHSGQGARAKFQLFQESGAPTEWTAETVQKILARISLDGNDREKMPPARKDFYGNLPLVVRGLATHEVTKKQPTQ